MLPSPNISACSLAPTQGGRINVTGAGFLALSAITDFIKIYLGDRECQNTNITNDNLLSCLVPDGVGKGHPIKAYLLY